MHIKKCVSEQRTMADSEPNESTQAFLMTNLMKMIVEKDRLITSLPSRGAAGNASESTAVVPSFQVMPDLSKSIADFTGEGDASEAKEWIESVQSAATLHKWPNEFKLETTKSHLKGLVHRPASPDPYLGQL